MNEALMLNVKELQRSVKTGGETADLAVEKENPKGQETIIESRALKQDAKKIRVLLMDDHYESYYHSAVAVQYDGKEEAYTLESKAFEEGPVVIECDGNGIVITSLTRQQGNPTYQGSIEIRKTENGLLLINELLVETYLEAVVPSEMPAFYEEEALKAQAVCARTYAYKQMENGALMPYGADVDDSVNYQVYANVAPQERTSKAVKETEGQVIYQGQELIEAYYFSTSSGQTSTNEIWGAVEAASYLKSVECTYDSAEIWSNWNVEIPWNILEEYVKENFNQKASALNLQVNKKSQSGAVTEMCVITDCGNYELQGEYEIREFLSPQGMDLIGNDGKSYQGGYLLPSAYFEMEVQPGIGVLIKGKGYGHGVGMSQNAADAMAKLGYTWREIIEYFYKDIEIREYKDDR